MLRHRTTFNCKQW